MPISRAQLRQGRCIWLTGCPSAGKTTLAAALRDRLWAQLGIPAALIDADDLRQSITKHLGFSMDDRAQNVGTIAFTAGRVVETGGVAVVACVAPTSDLRNLAMAAIGPSKTTLVYLACPLEERARRDSRGLYALAARGEVTGLTGFDAPYEMPSETECARLGNEFVELRTDLLSVKECAGQLVESATAASCSLFLGRWAPFHLGHKRIVDTRLEAGDEVVILVRSTQEWPSVGTRVHAIRATYAADSRVTVAPIDDVTSICVGREPGYAVRAVHVPEEVSGVSATEIRRRYRADDMSWKQLVPDAVAAVLCDGKP